MFKKSMQDVAFDLMSKKKRPVEFTKLWSEVTGILGLSEEEAMNKIASFYTRLTLDGRFVNLGDNIWDLRSRQTFDKVHIDMNDAYTDEEEEEDEKEIPEEIVDDEEIVAVVVEDEEEDEDDYGDGE